MQQIGRLESQKAASDRQLAIASAQERSGQATLRGAETRNRALREDMIRLKGTVAQVRAQCASDVRRRDGEIARLKKHLDGRRVRDGVTNGHIGVVLVTQGNHKGSNGLRVGGDSACTADGGPESLKQDTTEFLTRLSQGLSDENDALVGLVRGTLTTLRSLQGLAEDDGREWGSENGPTQIDSTHIFMDGAPSHESLAVSTDEVLEHLRGLLTNPSFVPLEEVVTREEEIQRLREGWERMAVRWKEAVALMGSWKKRMVNEGDTINLEDLKTGLKLGSGIPTAQEARISPLRVRDAAIDRDDSNLSEIAAQGRKGGPIEEDTVTDWHQKLGALAGSTERALRETSANPKTAPSATISIPEEETLTASEDESSLLDLSREKRISATAMKPSVSRIPLQVSMFEPFDRDEFDAYDPDGTAKDLCNYCPTKISDRANGSGGSSQKG